MVCPRLAALCGCEGGDGHRGDSSDDGGGSNTNVDTTTYYQDAASQSRRAALISMRRLSLFRGDVREESRRRDVDGASTAVLGLRQLNAHHHNTNNSSIHRSRRGRSYHPFAYGELPPPGSGATGIVRFYIVKALVLMGLRYKQSEMEADYLIFFFSNQRTIAVAFCALAFVLVGIGTLMWASTIDVAFVVWDFFAVLVWGALAVGFVLLKRHNQSMQVVLDDAVMMLAAGGAGAVGSTADAQKKLIVGNDNDDADDRKKRKNRRNIKLSRSALGRDSINAGGGGGIAGATMSRRLVSAKRSEKELRWNAAWHERLTLVATAAIVWFCVGLNGAQGSCEYVAEDRRQYDCREAINAEGLLFLFITTTVFLTPTRLCFLLPIYVVWLVSVVTVLLVAVPNIVGAYFRTQVILVATELTIAVGTLYFREHHRRFDFDNFMERQMRAAELEAIRTETERMLTAQLPLEVTRRLAAAGALRSSTTTTEAAAVFGGGPGPTRRTVSTYMYGWELSRKAVVCVFSLQGFSQWCVRRSPIDAIALVRCFFETLDAVRERFEHETSHFLGALVNKGGRGGVDDGDLPPPISKFHTVGDRYIVVRDVSASFYHTSSRRTGKKHHQEMQKSVLLSDDAHRHLNATSGGSDERTAAVDSGSQSSSLKKTTTPGLGTGTHDDEHAEEDEILLQLIQQVSSGASRGHDDGAALSSLVCADDAMCLGYCVRSTTAAAAAVEALCAAMPVIEQGQRSRRQCNRDRSDDGTPLQVACGVAFGSVRGNFFVGAKNVSVEGPAMEDALACVDAAPGAAAAVPIEGIRSTTTAVDPYRSAVPSTTGMTHTEVLETHPVPVESSTSRRVVPAVVVSEAWLQAAVQVLTQLHTAALPGSSSSSTTHSIPIGVKNPLSPPRCRGGVEGRAIHSPNVSSSSTRDEGADSRSPAVGTVHHTVAAILHRCLERTLDALVSERILLPHQLHQGNHSVLHRFLFGGKEAYGTEFSCSDVVLQVHRGSGCVVAAESGVQQGSDGTMLLSPRNGEAGGAGGASGGGSGNVPQRPPKRTTTEPAPSVDGGTSQLPIPPSSPTNEAQTAAVPAAVVLSVSTNEDHFSTTLRERCLLFSTFIDPRTEAAYRSYLSNFLPQDAIWAGFAAMLSLSALVGVMSQYDGIWGRLSDGLGSPLLLILIGYGACLIAMYLEWWYDVWKPVLERPVRCLGGLTVRNSLQCFLSGIVSLCYCGVTFLVPSEGNIIGNSQLLWMLVLLNWSLLRPTWLHPLLLWVGDAMLAVAYLFRTYLRFDMLNTSRLSLMYMEAAMVLFCLVVRMLLDQSKRSAFANELESTQLKEQLQRDQQRLEETVKLLAPEGIAAQMLEHSKKVRRLRGGTANALLLGPSGGGAGGGAQPPQQPPHPLTSTNWCTSVWEVPVAIIRLDPSLSIAAPLLVAGGGGGGGALVGEGHAGASLIRRRSTTTAASTAGSVGMLTPRNHPPATGVASTPREEAAQPQQQRDDIAPATILGAWNSTEAATAPIGLMPRRESGGAMSVMQPPPPSRSGLPPIVAIPYSSGLTTAPTPSSAPPPSRGPQHPSLTTQPAAWGEQQPTTDVLVLAAHRIVVDTAAQWRQLPYMRLELYKASMYELRVCVASLPGGPNGDRRDLDEERSLELLKFVAVVERKLQARLPKRTPTPPNSRRPSIDLTSAAAMTDTPSDKVALLRDDGPFPCKAPTYRIALSVGPLIGGVVGRGSVSYDYYGPAVLEAVGMLDAAQVLGCGAPPVLLTRRFAKYCAAVHINVPVTLQRILAEETACKAKMGPKQSRPRSLTTPTADDGDNDDRERNDDNDQAYHDWDEHQDTVIPLGSLGASNTATLGGDAKLSGSTSDDAQAVLSRTSCTWCLHSIGPVGVHYARFI